MQMQPTLFQFFGKRHSSDSCDNSEQRLEADAVTESVDQFKPTNNPIEGGPVKRQRAEEKSVPLNPLLAPSPKTPSASLTNDSESSLMSSPVPISSSFPLSFDQFAMKKSVPTEGGKKAAVEVAEGTSVSIERKEEKKLISEEDSDASESSSSSSSSSSSAVVAASSATSVASPSVNLNDGDDYLARRAARIAENRAKLASLGLLEAGEMMTAGTGQRRPKKSAPRKRKPASVAPVKKYSLRSKKSEGISSSAPGLSKEGIAQEEKEEDEEEDDDEEEEETCWDDSNVVRYVTSAAATSDETLGNFSVYESRTSGNSASRRRLERVGAVETMSDSALKKIYSMDFGLGPTAAIPASSSTSAPSSPLLLAAGGNDGRVVVFGVRGGEGSGTPLLSWRAHRGWISAVNFSSSYASADAATASSSSTLLTAGNDGCIALWDICQSSSHGEPRKLASLNEAHQRGVFSAHTRGSELLSGGKDGTVLLSAVRPSDIGTVHRFESTHSVVKCVRWKPEESSPLFASCGNDNGVTLWDSRSRSTLAELEPAHALACNSVRWGGSAAPNLIFSASFHPSIMVHDIRQPKQALRTLRGFAPSSAKRTSRIFHPVILSGGERLLVAGEKSATLVLYDVNTGLVLSRGEHEGREASALASVEAPADSLSKIAQSRLKPLVAVATGRYIDIFENKE